MGWISYGRPRKIGWISLLKASKLQRFSESSLCLLTLSCMVFCLHYYLIHVGIIIYKFFCFYISGLKSFRSQDSPNHTRYSVFAFDFGNTFNKASYLLSWEKKERGRDCVQKFALTHSTGFHKSQASWGWLHFAVFLRKWVKIGAGTQTGRLGGRSVLQALFL